MKDLSFWYLIGYMCLLVVWQVFTELRVHCCKSKVVFIT